MLFLPDGGILPCPRHRTGCLGEKLNCSVSHLFKSGITKARIGWETIIFATDAGVKPCFTYRLFRHFLLKIEIKRMFQMLERAASAAGEMFAYGLYTSFARRYNLLKRRIGCLCSFSYYARLHDIAFSCIRQKYFTAPMIPQRHRQARRACRFSVLVSLTYHVVVSEFCGNAARKPLYPYGTGNTYSSR